MRDDENYLEHIGTSPASGRYPKGSGENPFQRIKTFNDRINKMKKQGMSEKDIAVCLGFKSTQEMRNYKTLMRVESQEFVRTKAIQLMDKGYSRSKAAEILGTNESTLRSMLNPVVNARTQQTKDSADILKKAVAAKGYIDVGVGSEYDLGISRTKMKAVIQSLTDEGYTIHHIHVKQLATGKDTEVLTLAAPGVKYQEVYNNKDKIKTIAEPDSNGKFGLTDLGLEYPKSIDSKRVSICYAEDGGKERDGTIFIRPGVEDLSLGNSRYAQVRIAVDGKYYLKGMAVYSNEIPEGKDIVFNTNKTKDKAFGEVLKELKDNPDNPFGATIKAGGQRHYTDENGNDQLSPINKVNEEGDWSSWSKSLSSQVLSKQPVALAKQQLAIDYEIRKSEFADIEALTNPVVKMKLLQSYADGCDAAAVDLKAAALPRQASHVILPVKSLKDNEIYAPNYNDGETVVLIRYPHAGKFEIPTLQVNNKNKEARKMLSNAVDAVGINSNVAERLSGADFDGDTVLVIPNNNGAIKTKSPLAKLQNFDPKESYRAYEGMKKVKEDAGFNKQREMGKASNLITDMTLKGASDDEIAAAVRHSMVVIDAEKHNLDWRRSYEENGIAALKAKYQGVTERGQLKGASTLISKASSQYVDKERKTNRPYLIDPNTGERIWNYTEATYQKPIKDKKTGEIKGWKTMLKTTNTTKMDVAKDARELSSGYPIEEVYADYANKMKMLGNAARKALISTKPSQYSPEAAKKYSVEVASLKAQLAEAAKNAPRERQAQIYGNSKVEAAKRDNPNLTAEEVKKLSGQALVSARLKVGAKKRQIIPTPSEWEAIQNGAISTNLLNTILDNTNLDTIRKYATPKTPTGLSEAKAAQAKSMMKRGYTQAEIANYLGVSTSTINSVLNTKGG